MHLLFDCEKSAKPTAAPLISQPVIKLHLRVEFKFLNKAITKKEITNLANQFSNLVVEKVIDAPYVPGALDYIKKYYKQYKLFVSTGTPTEEIKQILKGRNIKYFFTDVFGSPDKKTVHINNIEINYGLKSNELIFYGDSNSDLDAAENAQIPFVLIKNKFNQTLSNSYGGKIINNFIDLL